MFFLVFDQRGTEVPGQPLAGWSSEGEAIAWAEDQELEGYSVKPVKSRFGTTLNEEDVVL